MTGLDEESAAPAMTRRGLRLRFRHKRNEEAFRRDYAERIRVQSQLGLLAGAVAYAILGLVDPWFFPESYPRIWALRLVVVVAVVAGLALTRSPRWWDHDQSILAFVAVVAGIGAVIKLGMGSPETVNTYYFGLALLVVWIHTFSGLRVAASLGVSTVLLAAYAAVVTGAHQLPLHNLVTNSLNLVVTTAIAALAGYVIEHQRRLVFAQTRLLEAERSNHQRRALHDHLTGLPNRLRFEADAEKARARAQRHGRYLAVLFVDLDGFKSVNDELGHHAGDQVLAAVARNLEQALRGSDTVARMGGDEFLVLLEDLPSAGEAGRVAEALLNGVGTPISVRNGTGAARIVRVSASIGVAVSAGESPLERLIRRADDAMYAAKAVGPGKYRQVGPGDATGPEPPDDMPTASLLSRG
ncbi:GGDEF domain-containing protein [Ectothiorhodospiraceae bacterium WFHF3C12]|nr:GGDEF domain-containing protein [Ectothiorhodospiraceae bacterium WFHF3C12]